MEICKPTNEIQKVIMISKVYKQKHKNDEQCSYIPTCIETNMSKLTIHALH